MIPLGWWRPIGARETYDFMLAHIKGNAGLPALATALGISAEDASTRWNQLRAVYGSPNTTDPAVQRAAARRFWGRRVAVVSAVVVVVLAWRRGWVKRLFRRRKAD